MQQLADGNNQFALNLYTHLKTDADNLFFSPYSISTALAMTYAGARENTERQMAETLNFLLPTDRLHPAFSSLGQHFQKIQDKGKIALQVANALWIQEDFDLLEDFLTVVKKYYDANLFQVNFTEAFEDVRQQINDRVADATNEKIQNLLTEGSLNALTRLVLTNAIYFKGNWTAPFEQEATQEDSFWMSADKSSPVPLMYQKHIFKYGEDDTMQILEMAYEGEDLTMTVLLPKTKDGLPALEKRLNISSLTAWLADMSYREVEVYFPKFRLTTGFSLANTLSAMGMPDAFSGNADFSGMEAGKQLSISDVIHKAFVEVNEEGTEAAAATAVIIGVTAVMDPQPVPVFRADHPFLFLIRDQRFENILFMGRFAKPEK